MASLIPIQYDQLPSQAFEYLSGLPQETKVLIFGASGVIFIALTLYVVSIYTQKYLEQRKKRYFIQIRFDQHLHYDQVYYTTLTSSFLENIHDLLRSSSFSWEILTHDGSLRFLVSSTDPHKLTTAGQYFQAIPGVQVSPIQTKDPLTLFNEVEKRLMGKRLFLKDDFKPIQTIHKNYLQDIIEYLSQNTVTGGLIFLLRPIDISSKLEAKIQKLSSQIAPQKSGTYSKQKKIELLEEKNRAPIFFIEIYLLSDDKADLTGLTSILKGIPGKNSFSSANIGKGRALLKKVTSRYLFPPNPFTPLFRRFQGSYFNTKELTSFFLPSANKSSSGEEVFVVKIAK